MDKDLKNGWLLVDKPIGMTSFDVVSRIKRCIKTKVGHSGTLDPFASGFLLIALGKATRLIEYAMNIKKSYTFSVQWGSKTETGDLTGSVIEKKDFIPKLENIERCIQNFLGFIDQKPHHFSAVKINGKRAYKLARQGVDIEMPVKKVFLDSCSVISHEKGVTSFEIICSKGFYVRSFANDLADSLQALCHVIKLRRNLYGIKGSYKLLNINQDQEMSLHKEDFYEYLTKNILPLDHVLDDIIVHAIGGLDAVALKKGRSVEASSCLPTDSLVAVKNEESLIAITKFVHGLLKPIKVF